MPNAIAYLMLLMWPIICLVMFRKLDVQRALIWSILGGYLLLPQRAEFNLPLVPALDKVSIPNLSVLAILMFATSHKLRLLPQSRLARLLAIGLVVSAVPTVMTNGEPILFQVLRNSDPIIYLTDVLPGQSIRDTGSVLIAQILTLVPFLLARQFLSDEKGLREILLALLIGGVLYSIPSLIEIRFSPQMNVWVYGFFQHSFEQMMRNGGFRPIVFLPHGLWLALFMALSLLAAAALTRVAPRIDRWKMLLLTLYVGVVLVLCKSLASILYGAALLPLVLFAPARWQVRLAVIFAVIALTYPMLRNLNLIPLDTLVAQANAFDPERGQSLEYRFNNEQQLLARAAEKPAFGWSGWGRSLVRHPETAEILSIPDGRWIIVFGTFGWFGYICEFGLLALPLLLMGRYIRLHRTEPLNPWIAPLTLVLGITMLDMLLNATLTPLTWLTAGAILGHVERVMPMSARRARHALATHPVMQKTGAATPRRTLM